jgi:hypothetical protein
MPSQLLTQLMQANANLMAQLCELEELRARVGEAEISAQTSEAAHRRRQSKPKTFSPSISAPISVAKRST